VRLAVPGNILLLGEYSVLEEGGLGIAIAIERRVLVEAEAGPELAIEGIGAGSAEMWRATGHDEASLLSCVVAAVEEELRDRGSGLPALSMRVDSRAFFDAEGRKMGLGSSAAVAAGIALTLLRFAGLSGPELDASASRAALAGHRARQGGRGSGYDIAASLGGGIILFTGGARPAYSRLELPWMRPLSFLRGPAPVDTAKAILSYRAWKEREPEAARRHLEASNETVRGFASARSWEEAESRLEEGATLGLALGRAIRVSAEIPAHGAFGAKAPSAKALGAGNELAAVWGAAIEKGELAPLEIAASGPLWTE
jgi:phosphomevalonate kinase